MNKKLWKVVEAIQELLQGTSAKVTLEWGDGTKVVITRHVIGARRPEKLKVEPVDDLKLYTFDEVTEINPEDWEALKSRVKEYQFDIPWYPREGLYDFKTEKITFHHGDGSTSTATLGDLLDTRKHDKIQGDNNNPWIVNDDGSPTT